MKEKLSPKLQLDLYRRMLKIRRVEEAVADQYPKQEMKCPIHLSIGQEAVPVGLCALLTKEDRVYSTHRCHAHYLAKNGNLPRMIAELYGKQTGCCEGKGGSMHLVDHEQGMMGASALVGGTLPMAVGSALTFKLSKQPLLAVAFCGDGATEEGLFYESLNFAGLKKLPVIFAVENNLYATYSHQSARQANIDITLRGKPFDVESLLLDGNDVQSVYFGCRAAVERARKGLGPTLIEFTTYRFRDHVGPNYDFEVGYRTKDEVEAWMEKCPIVKLEAELKQEGVLTDSMRSQIEGELKQEIEQAFRFAHESPLPTLESLYTDIYANP